MSDAYTPLDSDVLAPAELKQTEEGLPFYQAREGAPPGDTLVPIDEAKQAREAAAARLRRSVTERSPLETDFSKAGEAFTEGLTKAPQEAIKSWYESTEGRYYPPEARYIGDDGTFYDAEMKPIPQQRKPDVLPLTKDPTTGEIQPAMPGILDMVNTIGSPASGAATLGAGFVRRPPPGLGHNLGPPMPPHGGVPPPPIGGAPPGLVPSPREIVRGHDATPPMTWSKFYTQVFDNLHPLKLLQNEMAQHGAIAPQEEFYQLGRLTRGSPGRTQQMLEHGTFDYHTLQNNGMPLRQVLEPVKDEIPAFENFAVAMRDLELLQRGINPGVTLSEAQNIVRGAPRHFLPALKNLHEYQYRVLKYLQDSGVVSAEQVRAMRAANRMYVPFYRVMDGPEVGTSTTGLRANKPIYKIAGSNRNILSPIESIIRNTDKFIDIAEKNRAINALVDAAERRGLTGLVERAAPDTHPVHVLSKELEKFLRDNGIPIHPAIASAPDSFTIFRPNAFRPQPGQISAWKNGKRQVYNVDPEVANAVNGMSREEVSRLVEWIAIPARLLRAGVTLAPEFFVKNMMRDQLMAAAQTRDGYIPFLHFGRGLGRMIDADPVFQMWLKSGGASVALVNMDRKYLQAEIKNMMESGWGNALKRTALNPLPAAERVQEFSEHPTRIGVFERALRQGKTPHQAGYVSREGSTDFARRGSSEALNAILRMTAFARPTMQGLDRLLRELKEKPNATLFKIGAYVSLPTLYFYFKNRQDPRVFDIPREERRLYWHKMQDDWQPISKEQAQTIPARYLKKEGDQNFVNLGVPIRSFKPFEVGFFFGTSLEMMLDKFFTDHPEKFKQITGKDFPKQESPFKGWGKGAASSVLPGFLPQAVLPATEAISNYSFFRERPLVSQRLKSPENRKYEYTPFTSETAKFVGSIIATAMPDFQLASPLVIENYIRGLSGTLGMYTLQGIDQAVKAGARVAGKTYPESPEMTIADWPVIKAFVTRLPSTVSTPITDFQENMENARTTKALISRIGKSPSMETDEKQRERESILGDRSAVLMANASKAIGNLYRQIEIVQSSKTMTPKDKTLLIQTITLNMMRIADFANAAYAKDRAGKAKP